MAVSGFAITMSSICSRACGPATSTSFTANARRKSRGCFLSLYSRQSLPRGMLSPIQIICDAQMRSFASLASLHRVRRTRFGSTAPVLVILSGQAIAEPSGLFVDLASDLASKIADALAPAAAIRLEFSKEDTRVQSEVTGALSARGFRVVDGGEATLV